MASLASSPHAYNTLRNPNTWLCQSGCPCPHLAQDVERQFNLHVELTPAAALLLDLKGGVGLQMCRVFFDFGHFQKSKNVCICFDRMMLIRGCAWCEEGSLGNYSRTGKLQLCTHLRIPKLCTCLPFSEIQGNGSVCTNVRVV